MSTHGDVNATNVTRAWFAGGCVLPPPMCPCPPSPHRPHPPPTHTPHTPRPPPTQTDTHSPLPPPPLQATPSADSAMFYFQTNQLGFTPEFLGRVRLAACLAQLGGIALYNGLLKVGGGWAVGRCSGASPPPR